MLIARAGRMFDLRTKANKTKEYQPFDILLLWLLWCPFGCNCPASFVLTIIAQQLHSATDSHRLKLKHRVVREMCGAISKKYKFAKKCHTCAFLESEQHEHTQTYHQWRWRLHHRAMTARP